MKLSLRFRLLAVALLGLVSCGVSIFGLGRILNLNNATRMERARETVALELAALRREPGETRALTRISVLGMRGGFAAGAEEIETSSAIAEEGTRRALAAVARRAAAAHDAALQQAEGEGALVMYGAAPTTNPGMIAWIVYTVRPSPFIGMWRFILVALTLATLLLLATAISTLLSVRRGVATLNAALAALAGDLSAPVPRPPVPELSDLADHIAHLARELARAQCDKERLGAELAQRDRLSALGRVAAGVAHEVRNPLAAIKLRVDLGRMRSDTPQRLAHELLSVSDEITRLDRLVADLLVVAGRRDGPRRATALGELCARRVSLLAPWAGERGVRIEASGDAEVAIDADAVARAVDNLVRNAVEASPEGEAVLVRIDADESAARVRVIDRGAGVADARLPELFEPFFTTKPEGTGLGLALSRAIAAAHGGTLTYAREGGATSFELTIPRAPRGARLPEAA
jgi:signal transduction histidine kinase